MGRVICDGIAAEFHTETGTMVRVIRDASSAGSNSPRGTRAKYSTQKPDPILRLDEKAILVQRPIRWSGNIDCDSLHNAGRVDVVRNN